MEQRKRKLFVVVHAVDNEQACQNAEIAARAGADGIFLIGHKMGALRLLEVYEKVRRHLPGFWIGVNFLGISARDAMDLLSVSSHGLWTDNIEIDEDLRSPSLNAQSNWHAWLERKKERKEWNSLYFAGVAFKYQKQPHDLSFVLQEAVRYCDVITTSGTGTGESPSMEKIQFIREVIGDFPLAVASGITLDNVESFLPYIDHFLVSTGISKSFDELDYYPTKNLAHKIHQY